MDYNMRISMVIDSETKKNSIRNTLKTSLEGQYDNGNLKSWNMDINAVIVPTEDNESYTSPSEEE